MGADALDRYPLPPRNPQVGDPRAETPDGFESVADEFYADDIDMTQQQFADYQLSISNFVAAGGTRRAARDELRAWLLESTAPLLRGASTSAPCGSSARSPAYGVAPQ